MSDLDDLIESLSYNEKKVLLLLGDEAEAISPEELKERGDFRELVECMNAASWLKSKGLLEISESLVKYYSLAKKQYGHKDLPERRALRLLHKKRGPMTLEELRGSSKLKDQEVPIAIGWLKRKGWADIRKEKGETLLSITERGEEYLEKKGDDELLIERLGKEELEESQVDQAVIGKLRSRQDVVREREVVLRSLSLTEEGRKVLDAGLELKEEVAQLTPELIQSGEWREVDFRRYDVKTFAPAVYGGSTHPLVDAIEEIREIFLEMGFTEIRGDYVESCFWNMDALFIPQDHPARELQDTFYVENKRFPEEEPGLAGRIRRVHEDGGDTGSDGWRYPWSQDESRKAILRTHTTVNTIRYLSQHSEPPVKVFSIGRVFRKEAIDATHLPEFYQIEGIIMEEGANFSMLIGTLKEFYSRMGFEHIRFRPAYFPYTEPSMEVEVEFRDRWLELGGSGIFRPEVTLPFGVKHPVLAWGLGLERLAMLRLDLKDLRDLYVSDMDWLRKAPPR